MPTFTVLNARMRDPNTEYVTDVYTVPQELPYRFAEVTITEIDLINEPSTTSVQMQIERTDGAGWRSMGRSNPVGLYGVPPPKLPYGTISRNLDNVLGEQVRLRFSFTSAGDAKKRIGVDLTVFN
jgi:hypothetical protein